MEFQREKSGQIITLHTPPHAMGGEAYLYTVAGADDLLAKVYHQASAERAEKLLAMVNHPPDDPMAAIGQPSIAWPLERLMRPDQPEECIGFLMPRLPHAHSLFEFYNPKTRRLHCPLFHYGYLIRTARNLASAFHALHKVGYVIGDVNESNILASETALITLVDTDSFQVPSGDTLYRCPVGKPEFTPPELQGVRFREVLRKPEHDVFGLAVLIFLLLMEGTHPFAGRLMSGGEPASLGDRIAANYYIYQIGRQIPYEPMPTAPPVGLLHPELRALMRQCFETGHANPSARPTAQQWEHALEVAEKNLRACRTNPQHLYRVSFGACPWCDRAKLLGGWDPFPSREAVKQGTHVRPLPVPAPEEPPAVTPPVAADAAALPAPASPNSKEIESV